MATSAGLIATPSPDCRGVAAGAACMQIQLSDRWLLTLNATAEVVDMVLPEGEWRAVPPFAGEDNPVIMAVWHGPAHGVCVFQRS